MITATNTSVGIRADGLLIQYSERDLTLSIAMLGMIKNTNKMFAEAIRRWRGLCLSLTSCSLLLFLSLGLLQEVNDWRIVVKF